MECSKELDLSYREFSRRIHSQGTTRRIPLDGTIELTYRCNFKCIHCYCNLPADDKSASGKEMTTQEILRIIDEITEEGCLWLLFTGGEPLLRKDFKQVYLYAKRKGMVITLFTNGSLITKEMADFLREYPPFIIEITLYGMAKETYEKITGNRNSFQQVFRGVDFILERKIPLRLKTVALRANLFEMAAIKGYCEERNVPFRFDSHISPRLDGSLAPCQARLSPIEVVEMDLTDKRRLDAFKKSYREFEIPSAHDFVYNCGGGLDCFSINPYGKLQLCQSVTEPCFDLRKRPFHNGWINFLPKIRLLPRKQQSPCYSCRIQPLCVRCPAWAKQESGNPEAPIEYLCQIASLRQEAFGLKN